MTMQEYQEKARRTQNTELCPEYRVEHATWGLAAEVGEVLSLFQKTRQGHELFKGKVADEAGDVLWFLCELLDCLGLSLDEVARANVAKLEARYPDGFSAERSLHRDDD